MTPHSYEIGDGGAFCEVIFFCISPKKLLGDFFDSLSCSLQGKNSDHHARFPAIILKKIIFTKLFSYFLIDKYRMFR
jgi:hypothetical protein